MVTGQDTHAIYASHQIAEANGTLCGCTDIVIVTFLVHHHNVFVDRSIVDFGFESQGSGYPPGWRWRNSSFTDVLTDPCHVPTRRNYQLDIAHSLRLI